MLGGYQILDLRKIDLSRGTSEASITDADALRQLLNIRDHIEKTYDFSKPLQNQLKPLLIRYRDKKVGEKHEVSLYGNIEVINVYYKFRIITNNEGEQLTINVEFEEKTDEYDNKYWDIKTATILLTTNVDIKGDLTANSIIEKMNGYAFQDIQTDHAWDPIYASVVKNGNKLTFCVFGSIVVSAEDTGNADICQFTLPSEVLSKLIPYELTSLSILENRNISYQASTYDLVVAPMLITKFNTGINFRLGKLQLLPNSQYGTGRYYFRIEQTFLLSDNLVSNE